MADIPTLAFYAANAAAYAADGAITRRLAAFLDLIPAGGRILELGTGSGYDAKAMLDQGFDVFPTDGSPALAGEAERRLGRPVRIMLFDELDALDAFDGIFANAALLHAERAALPSVIAKIHRALHRGGVVWASFKAGDGEGRDSVGRYYNYPIETELRSLWTALNWASIEIVAWPGSGYDRQATNWLGVTARK